MQKNNGRRGLMVPTYSIIVSMIMLVGILVILSAFLRTDRILLYYGLCVTGIGVVLGMVRLVFRGRTVNARRETRNPHTFGL